MGSRVKNTNIFCQGRISLGITVPNIFWTTKTIDIGIQIVAAVVVGTSRNQVDGIHMRDHRACRCFTINRVTTVTFRFIMLYESVQVSLRVTIIKIKADNYVLTCCRPVDELNTRLQGLQL